MDTIVNTTTDLSSVLSPRSEKARKLVLTKGVVDIFLSLSLVLFPSLLYDGPIPAVVTAITGLAKPNWSADSGAAYGLSALIMGCAFAGITAGTSISDDAYKTVATLHGIFALSGLLGCILSPGYFGSSFLLLASLQDAIWFTAIVQAGEYGVLDTLGISGKRYVAMKVASGQAKVATGADATAGAIPKAGMAVAGSTEVVVPKEDFGVLNAARNLGL